MVYLLFCIELRSHAIIINPFHEIWKEPNKTELKIAKALTINMCVCPETIFK